MAKRSTVTMKDIAASLNVSTGLVSYVLNGRGDEMRISKEMQRRVHEKATEMNYRPNLYAKRVRQSVAYCPTFSIFWPYQSDAELLNAVFSGIHDLMIYNPVEFDIMLHLYERHRLSQYGRYFNGARSDGALICNFPTNDGDFIENNQFPIPIVLMNRHSTVHSCAYVNPEIYIQQTAELAFQAGITTIGLLYADNNTSHHTQAELWRECCAKAGILLRTYSAQYPISEDGGARATAEMLRNNNQPPELLIALSKRLARGAQYLLRKAGITESAFPKLLVVTNQLQRQDPTLAAWSAIQLPIDKMCNWCISHLLTTMPNQAPEAREFQAEWFLNDDFFYKKA